MLSINKLAFDWLNNNPHKWVGKKVRNRKSYELYTIHDVMRNGSVVLEKKWVMQSSDVQTIREDFVAASA